MDRGAIRKGRSFFWQKETSRLAIVLVISLWKGGDQPCGAYFHASRSRPCENRLHVLDMRIFYLP